MIHPSLKILLIVAARGGSKGIPRKNVLMVGGKPLIEWTIQAARSAKCEARVIVTTDCPEIQSVASSCGAEVPFLRPAELARDDTPGVAPVLHAVKWLALKEGYTPEIVGLLQPTSPLRNAEDVDESLLILQSRAAPAVVSVCPVSKHPYWMKKIASDGSMENLIPLDRPITRRQDLPDAFALNGAVYLIRREVLLKGETLFPAGTLPYVMPSERSLDIDSLWDLKLVDLVLKDRQREND